MRLWNRTREQMGSEAREIFAKEPARDPAMNLCLRAWSDLVTCRAVGFGDGRIPWTACDRWCERHRFDEESSDVLWAVIQRMDIEDLERRAFEARTDRPAAPSPRR